MTVYVMTNEGLKDRNGNRMPIPERDGLCLPMVISDIEPIRSPMDGKMITSRDQLNYELDKHGKRLQEPSESPTQGKIRNKAFAAKRGLKVSKEYNDR